ncbi:MAG: hypothetical protein WCD54_19665, partial [Pseudolabrys sp.]
CPLRTSNPTETTIIYRANSSLLVRRVKHQTLRVERLFLNKLTGKYSERRRVNWRFCGVWGHRRYDMKKLLISMLATALVVSFAVSAEAAGNKQRVSADVQASCKAQAAKKYSAIHFMKRRDFVNNCVAQHAKASAPKAAKPATTGQAPKQAQ